MLSTFNSGDALRQVCQRDHSLPMASSQTLVSLCAASVTVWLHYWGLQVNGDHQGEHSLASNAVDSYHPPQGAEARSAHHTNAASEPASTSGRGMKGGGRSRQLSQAEARQLGSSALRLWTNICLCHSLIVEDAPDGIKKVFQVRSRHHGPDVCSLCLTKIL